MRRSEDIVHSSECKNSEIETKEVEIKQESPGWQETGLILPAGTVLFMHTDKTLDAQA